MQPIDLTLALKATDGDVELLKDVIEAFLEEYPVLLAQLEPAILAGDCAVVQRASHTIKGTLRLFGDVPAKGFAECLESMGQSGDLKHAAEIADSLKVALASLRMQLMDSMKDPFGPMGTISVTEIR